MNYQQPSATVSLISSIIFGNLRACCIEKVYFLHQSFEEDHARGFFDVTRGDKNGIFSLKWEDK